ncbi:hypothetical protein MCP1_210065 [Candidatus Terasakiella magnetica]|nr:hypothetical protein MCP1_210065 [Candidatus Terasakiella magnetica]
MDEKAVSSAELNVEPVAATPVEAVTSAAPEADLKADIAHLTSVLATTTQTARRSLGAAALAALIAVTSPWWVPRMVDNDHATRQTALLAVGQLNVLASRDAPFGPEFALLARVLPQDRATKELVAAVDPLAVAGAPTLETLREKFRGTADQVLLGKVVAKNDQSWVNWGLHKVAALVRIDTVASTVVEPSEDLRIVHAAEAALALGNLSEAVEQLSKLDGNSAQEVQDWVGDAKRRIALDNAVDGIRRTVEKRADQSAWVR